MLDTRPPIVQRLIAVNDWCYANYRMFDARVIHSLGLTDPILARVDMPADRPAHKLGLRPLALDLQGIYAAAGLPPRVGLFRTAVTQGRAPDWIRHNLETIEIIERKELNRHSLRENFGLALTFPPRIITDRRPTADAR